VGNTQQPQQTSLLWLAASSLLCHLMHTFTHESVSLSHDNGKLDGKLSTANGRVVAKCLFWEISNRHSLINIGLGKSAAWTPKNRRLDQLANTNTLSSKNVGMIVVLLFSGTHAVSL